MPVAESSHSHVTKADEAFARAIDKVVAVCRVKLGGSNNFRQFLHVGRLDVDYIEALISYVQMPEVDAQVISRKVCLGVRVNRDRIYVIRVRVGVDPTRGRLHHKLHWF